MDWLKIRHLNGKIEDGFEEFVSQLAKKEIVPDGIEFRRNGTPDAGCECYWILNDQTEWAWQAKFFTNSLGDAQIKQIGKSIDTAITTHPNIVKYFIAIPIDPPDPRIGNKKSMREKWNNCLSSWQKKYPAVEFVSWWSSDMISKIQTPENYGFYKFWFETESFTPNWFKNQNYLAIKNLGPRYTPEVNIELEVHKIFDGLSADNKLRKQYEEKLDVLLKTISKLYSQDADINNIINYSKSLALELEENFIQSGKKFDFNKIKAISNNIGKKIDTARCNIRDKIQKAKNIKENNASIKHPYSSENLSLYNAKNAFDDFSTFINSETIQLYYNPFLLLDGEAGSGKSHLLADIVNNRMQEGTFSLFLLGQHFQNDNNPRKQIVDALDLNCTFAELLEALECTGEIYKKRIIIFIDAINEGAGKSIWPEHLNGFIAEIKQYKNLGLVLSVRSTYKDLFIDGTEDLIKYTHQGFQNIEDIAAQQFFSHYGIEMPKIPVLQPEFSNPLFLMLFCKGLSDSKLTSIPEGLDGIHTVFNFFIDAINKKILKKDASIKIVTKIINELIAYEIKNNTQRVPYDEAAIIVSTFRKQFSINVPISLENFIDEGILIKDCNKKGEEFVDISYERLKDHLIAKYILENKINLSYNIRKKLLWVPITYQGIFDALAIQMPETRNKELFEVLKKERFIYNISESIIKSFVWRRKNTVNDEKKLVEYINNVAIKHHPDLFWTTIITCSTNPNNLFSADKIHNCLNSYSLAKRDAFWLPIINKYYEYKQYSIAKLLNWAMDKTDKSYISDTSIKLTLTMLGWFLVSSNRALRDNTTKALVLLLKDRPHLILEFIQKFENVNDPYIYERIYAAAYGAIFHTNDEKIISTLAKYVYNTIFNKEKVYPHILLRDYARNIVEYALYKGINLNKIDTKKIRPPYNSDFPIIPTDEQIKMYKIDFCEIEKNRALYGVHAILTSMRPEYTRKNECGGYGDFGRYVFQSGFSDFIVDQNNKLNFIMDLHNIAIQRIFDLGYSPDLHGLYDDQCTTHYYSRNPHRIERIGKKYQWIAFHELLAQVADNYKIKTNNSKTNCSNYSGPWEFYIRDIDPTNLNLIYNSQINSTPKYHNWTGDCNYWLNNPQDLPDVKHLLQDTSKEWVVLGGYYNWEEPCKIGKERYSIPTKSLFYIVYSYFVKHSQHRNIVDWLLSKNVKERWLPEKGDAYQLFNREYFTSPAYDFLHNNTYYNNLDKVDLIDKQESEEYEEISLTITRDDLHHFIDLINHENAPLNASISKDLNILKTNTVKRKKIIENKIGEVYFSESSTYRWEKDRDFSENTQNIIRKPCFDLYNFYKLEHNQYDNCLYTPNGDLACFDKNSILYFKKDLLLNYLKKKKLCFLWTVWGEKNIIGRYKLKKNEPYCLTTSGIYYFDDKDEIDGNCKTILEEEK